MQVGRGHGANSLSVAIAPGTGRRPILSHIPIGSPSGNRYTAGLPKTRFDEMPLSASQIAEQIHASSGRFVLAAAGGGSRAIAELLTVPGASRTLLEAVVPYSDPALAAWLGGRPDSACSPRTARAMAMAAFRRAWQYDPESSPAGVACSAGLTTDRPRRGTNRAHVALQTVSSTTIWSLDMLKDRRSRHEEENLVGHLLLNMAAEACGLEQRLELDLLEGEQIDRSRTEAPQSWQDLLLGKVEMVAQRGSRSTTALLPGAFNPLHTGHRRMAQIAEDLLDASVAMEISITNVDKPPLDYFEIERRVGQFSPEQPVMLTRAATFEEKSRLFPGATFVVGADTLRRIADPRYYGDNPGACLAALEQIAGHGCRFLVFGRDMGTGFMRLSDLDLPEILSNITRGVPAEMFREDVSSTAIRRAGKW